MQSFLRNYALWSAVFVFFSVEIANSAIYTKKIIVTGRSVVALDQKSSAEDRALEDALYQAALQAGANIEGYSSYANGILLDEQTFVQTDTRIMDYVILSKDETEESVSITIEAIAATDIPEVNEGYGRLTENISRFLAPKDEENTRRISQFDRDLGLFSIDRAPIKLACEMSRNLNLYMAVPRIQIGAAVPDWASNIPKQLSMLFFETIDAHDFANIRIGRKLIGSGSESGQDEYDYSALTYQSDVMRDNEYVVEFSIRLQRKDAGLFLKKKSVEASIDIVIKAPGSGEIVYKRSIIDSVDRGYGIGMEYADVLVRKSVSDSDHDLRRIIKWLVSEVVAKIGCLPQLLPLDQVGDLYQVNIGSADGIQVGDLAVLQSNTSRGGDMTPWIVLVVDSVQSKSALFRLLDPKKSNLVGSFASAKLIN